MILWVLCTLWLTTSVAAADTTIDKTMQNDTFFYFDIPDVSERRFQRYVTIQACMKDLDIGSFTFSASSETSSNPATGVFTTGWCASKPTKDQYIDVTFNVMGIKRLVVGPKDTTNLTSFPKEVRVQYTPMGSTGLQDFSSPLIIKVDKPATSTSSFGQGIAMFKLRFLLQDFDTEPCMKLALKGCAINELCAACVHGTCMTENTCHCRPGYLGDGCDIQECTPAPLGLEDGSLPSNQISVSSEFSPYTKDEIRKGANRMGWCPAVTDKSPWASFEFDKPMAVKTLSFTAPLKQAGQDVMYMNEFELLYIAPQDSTDMLRSFHSDITSLNATTYFSIILIPALITDTIHIRPTKVVNRACFKLELYGCDPKGMCSQNWCQNGGSCIGLNACLCAQGFFGERCELTQTQIPVVNTTFISITNNVLITTSLHFTVTGQVTLSLTNPIPVLFLTGVNSYVQLKETSTAIACLKNVNKCTSGFTFAIDVKFDKLLDNTYIISSGGDLANHHGIALYYTSKTLVYVVTTTSFRWELRVPYTPVLNVWQHFEITWNKNIGMELHLNGHLLGTVGRPDPVSTSQTLSLCIGCSHTSVQVEVSMHIKEFHTWTIDRTELVNAGLKPTPAPATTAAPVASTTPRPSTKPPTASTTTTSPAVTTPGKGYQEYNLTFISIVNNLLITPTFNFTLHGKPALELEPNSHTAIVLDCTKQQYVELPDHGIPCLEDLSNCSKGFTFRMQVQFTSIDVTKKTYILSSGGDIETASGMAIYLHSDQLIFGVKQGMKHWSASYNMTGSIKTNVWYSFEISWSNGKGVSVVIDGYEVIHDNDWTPSPFTAQTNPVLIGKTTGSNTTSCMKVRDLFTWTIHRDVLVSGGILQNTPSPTTTSTTTQATTTTTIPTTTIKRDPLHPYHLTCIRQQGNVMYTHENGLTFLTHGHPVLIEIVQSILYTVTLNSITGDYLELRNKGVTCIDQFSNCNDGFTVMIKLSIVTSGQSSKIYIVSNGGENIEKSGMYLYYQGSHISLGFRHETSLWETSKQYHFISGVVYTLLFSWSETDGLLLYINDQLIGHVQKPVTAPISPSPGVLTIGKAAGTTTSTIYDLKIWTTSFQTLLYHSVFTTTITTTQSTTTTVQPSTTDYLHALVSASSYNLTFTSIQNNILYTPGYTFTVTGKPVLHHLVSGQTVLQLNSSKGEYIKLSNQTIPCLTDFTNCSNGLTFHIKVNFLQTDTTTKIYIVGNGGKQQGLETFYLYYFNHKLYFGTIVGHLKWSSEIKYEITTNISQVFELSWSSQFGIQLYVNGLLLKSSNVTTQTNTTSTSSNSISIGKPLESGSTFSIMISEIHFWSVSRNILTAANVVTTINPTVMSTSGLSFSTTEKKTIQPTEYDSTTKQSTTQTTVYSSISTTSYTNSSREPTNTLPTQQKTTTSVGHISTEYHVFNFLNISGNTVITTAFTLTAHGNLHIVNILNNQTAIKLNSTNSEYLELKNNSITCTQTTGSCHGFVNSIKLNFLSIQQNVIIYIFKGPGLFLYYQNKTLHFAYTLGHKLWQSHVHFSVKLNHWHTFKLTWSKISGLSLVVDGHLLKSINESVHTAMPSKQTFKIGLVTTTSSTTFLITGFEIHREIYTMGQSPGKTTSTVTVSPTKDIGSTTQLHQTVFTTYYSTTSTRSSETTTLNNSSVHVPSSSVSMSPTLPTTVNSKTTSNPLSTTFTPVHTYSTEGNRTSIKTTTVQSGVTTSSTPESQTSSNSKSTTTSGNPNTPVIPSSAIPETTTMNIPTTIKPTYNLGFLNITDGKIFTHSYTFTVHGNMTLFTLTSGQNVVQINSSRHEYIELKNQSIPCVDNKQDCTGGFSFQMHINFVNIDNGKTSYIIQTTGTTHAGAGVFLYILNSTLYLGYTYHNLSWTANIKYELKTENWYEFKLIWSQTTGLGLYINGELVIITNTPSRVDVVGIPSSLTIGKNQINVVTTFQIYEIKIWPYAHETATTTPSYYSTTTEENIGNTTPTLSSLPVITVTVTGTQSSSVAPGVSTSVSSSQTDNTQSATTGTKTDTTMQPSSIITDTTAIKSTFETDKSTQFMTTAADKSTSATTTAVTHTVITITSASAPIISSSGITTVATPISFEQSLSTQHSTTVTDVATSTPNTGTTSITGGYASTITAATPKHTTEHTEGTNQPISFESHNLSFINITGNLIYTSSFIISTHGLVTIEKTSFNETAVRLNGTSGAYIELKTPNISCIDSHNSCTHGLTVKVKVQLLSFNSSERTYIIVSSGSVPGSSGLMLYYQNKTLYFTSISQNRTWETSVKFEIKQNVWHTYELSWSLSYGLGLYVDGTLVKSTNVSSSTSTSVPSRPGSLTVGTALGATYSASLLVTGLHIWSASREIVYQAQAQTTEPSSPTPAPTTPTTTTTAKPTTTATPIPSFTWNFTQTVNVTINGNVPIKDGGLYFTNATQYIDFGNTTTFGCLLNPDSCKDGLTVQFTIIFKRVEENTYLLTSGGQLPNGMGLAVIFRFNFFQFILSTSTQSWYVTCHRSELTPNKPHNIMLSWQHNLGLEIFINNVLITGNKNPASHVSTSVSVTNVYFGKQTSVTVTGNRVKVEYVLQTITFWYAHLQILVDGGYCKPPVRPTEKPTTAAPVTTAKPATTQQQTSSVTTMFTQGSTQQCPVGCVSVASTNQPTATPTAKPTTAKPTTTKPTTTAKPTTTKKTSTAKPTTTTTKPTTERGPPNYTTTPTLKPIVGNDTKGYLECIFKTSTRDVQFTVQLKVDGTVVDQKVVSGQTGTVVFAVSKLNENLHQKKIECTVNAKYVGGTHTTVTFPSKPVIPGFTVTGKHIIAVEGKSTQHVTVTSTVPPHFYCCKGCHGQCQVHIVGSNNFNHRIQQKCNNNYIAQSVIVSNKPPNSNSPICGYALTNQNWGLHNKIEIKATIDNRRDGDHTNTMSILAHVYNQPANVQISAKPNFSFTITTVQVTAKDNHASSTCKSVNDPHMRTFDGTFYNNMKEGVFTLFRHKTLPFEVRAMYHKCSKRSHATCNCAVAVQSGDDVITVTGCHGTNNNHPGQGHGIGLIMQQLFGHGHDELAKTPMTIQIYKNGEFTPGTLIRRYGCGQKYEIELPTGMIVTVQQSYKPFINIYIRGASTDKGESEGLCGNFDGSRSNDLKPSTSAFINAWKSTYENFFYGVTVSSVQFQATYCSCIKDRTRICLAGIGAFRCVQTNNDITSSLVKQAKRPILTRHKRQAIAPTLPATDIPTEGPIDTPEVAEKYCIDHITNSDVTNSCTPVLTSNVTGHIQNCVDDYLATGSYEWAKDALRDIAVECIDNINDMRLANESGNPNITDEIPNLPDNIDEILNKSCVDDCGTQGSCAQGVCVCNDGYSGVNCDISKATVPTTSIVPFLCDMSSTSDCQGAMVFGENFVDTPSLTCHYEYATVSHVITPTGEKGTVSASFISINQVECPLPRSQTALLTVSNDGTNPSTNASMQVIFNSVCHSCAVNDTTFKASCYRKDNNCIIEGTCYADGDTRSGDQCQVCRPATNESKWSQSFETICQEKAQPSFVEDDDTNKTTLIALAVVCGVLAAILVIGAICMIRKKGSSKKSKAEFGSYDITPTPSVHRQYFNATDNPAYSSGDQKL